MMVRIFFKTYGKCIYLTFVLFSKNLWILLLLSCVVAPISGYKVLFLAPGKAKSHFIFVSPFVRAILDRGHEVTYLTSNTLNLKMKNYTEILLDDVPKTIGTSNNSNQFLLISLRFVSQFISICSSAG